MGKNMLSSTNVQFPYSFAGFEKKFRILYNYLLKGR